MPAPGRPSIPRSRCMLLTATEAAVAWCGVRFDVVLVDPVVDDQLLQQAVDQREVGTRPRRQMDLGRLRNRPLSWIDCDQA